VRQKLVETGDVDVMIAIRSNFFYTRTVPCELWFLNRDKPEEHRDKVLMLDARSIYRIVTRKICDFSPEQAQNLLAIAWLYRGQTEEYLNLVTAYCRRTLDEVAACFDANDGSSQARHPLSGFVDALEALVEAMRPFLGTLSERAAHSETWKEFCEALPVFHADVEAFRAARSKQDLAWEKQKITGGALKEAVERLAPLAESSRDLIRQSDLLYKLATRLIETCENECDARSSVAWTGKDITRARKDADEARGLAIDQLRQVRYFWRQAHWLTERFPDAKLRDVEGLIKLVDRAEIEANDWSLTPGRYVGVAPEEEDESFDFEETLRGIRAELESLDAEAAELAETIKGNLKGLGA
jgi:type I restriction enzyme M protein